MVLHVKGPHDATQQTHNLHRKTVFLLNAIDWRQKKKKMCCRVWVLICQTKLNTTPFIFQMLQQCQVFKIYFDLSFKILHGTQYALKHQIKH